MATNLKSKNHDSLMLFTGNSNPALAKEVAQRLNVKLGDALVSRFPEGEIQVQIRDNIRGKDVFLIQSTCNSPNDYLMELLIMVDAARRASARRITAVLPFYGYARQDRKDRPRVPITAKLVANLLVSAGASRVLTMDLHSGQIQGFFDIPVDHLYSINIMGQYLKKKKMKNLVIVSPDVGGIKMARAYAKMLGANFAVVDKRREDAAKTHVMHIIGEVKGKNVVIVDDLISTGGSVVEASKALKANGALDIYVVAVHPVLAGPAIERLTGAPIKEVIVSNSIPLSKEKQIKKITQLSVAPLLADAIARIHYNVSVSELFKRSGVEA